VCLCVVNELCALYVDKYSWKKKKKRNDFRMKRDDKMKEMPKQGQDIPLAMT
jgi:hypothetical protein